MSVKLEPTQDDLKHLDGGRYPVTNVRIRERMIMERAVIRCFLESVLAHKDAALFAAVDNGEEEFPSTRELPTLMEQIQSVDEDYIRVYAADDVTGQRKHLGSVFLMYGNAGWEVIADYHTSLEFLMGPVNALIDKLTGDA